mmetsp:Transcript_15264/g.32500  ORF Transcript_15264/g.32500 Transcript_15264/m.32500 type:complete len:227 (-) Transcript_15264:638-1318(-)
MRHLLWRQQAQAVRGHRVGRASSAGPPRRAFLWDGRRVEALPLVGDQAADGLVLHGAHVALDGGVRGTLRADRRHGRRLAPMPRAHPDAQVALRPRLQAGAAPRPLSHGAERGARVSAGQDGRGARGASAADDGAQCATGRRRHASRALRRAGRGARQVRDHRVLSDAVHARADLHPLCLQERHPKQRRRKGNPLRRAADAARCGPLAQRFEQPCAGSLALQHVTR